MLWYLYLFIFIYNFHLLLRFLTSLYHLWWIKPFIILSFCAAQRKLCRSWSKDNWQLSQLVAKLLKLNRTPTISCIRLLLAAYFNTEMSLSVPTFTTIPSLRLSNEVRASLCKFRALPRLWQCRRLSSVPNDSRPPIEVHHYRHWSAPTSTFSFIRDNNAATTVM